MMNSHRAVILAHRAFRWSNCQTFVYKCSLPGYQVVMKMPQLDFSSLVPLKQFVPSWNPVINIQRNYASKKVAKKKGKEANVQVSMSGLGELIEVDNMVKQMEGTIEAMKTEYVKTISLRSAGSIESLKVKFEGKEYELQQIAKMTRKGQQTAVVDMLSFPQMTKAVMETLKTSSLNLNPQQEGTTIFVPIPKVTKEHREILAKRAKALFITCRDTIKQVQEKYIKELRETDMGDSEKQSAYKQVRAVADKYVAQAELIMKVKQDELLGK